MKKHLKILIGSISVLVLTCAIVLTSIHAVSYLNNKTYNVYAAYALNDEDKMLEFNSSSNISMTYSPFEKSFYTSNYNNDEIKFSYKRAKSVNEGFIRLSGGGDGGYLYNDFIDESKNFNGLDGITSIVVNFSTVSGSLILETGRDDTYGKSTSVVTNSPITFTSLEAPSHFRLKNTSGAGENYDVTITSISITYHDYLYYTNLNPEFTQIISSQPTQTIPSGGSYIVSPDFNVDTKNYIKLLYSTSENIKGEIEYQKNGETLTNTETFFLEKNTDNFTMFLDAFRNTATAKYSKTIKRIKFTNVGSSSASFSLSYFGMSNASYTRSDCYYIEDSMLRVGISLRLGGAIASVQNISTAANYNIQEYVDSSGEIKIQSADKSSNVNNVIATHPNLVNTFDLGREIQQSYYFGVDSTNGYERGTFDGKSRDYNPVQAGDNNKNESQIVDFKITKNTNGNNVSIWIKTKACDWAKSNEVTNSYMENTYTISNGILNVNNRFIDWTGFANYPFNDDFEPYYISDDNAASNGWTNRETTFGILGKQTMELPAMYAAHPLKYYSTVAETNKVLIFDENQGWNSSTSEQSHAYYNISGQTNNMVQSGTYNGEPTYKSINSAGTYHYSTRIHPENWLGYFNEDYFGVALYMPATSYNHEGNRHVFTAGNYKSSHNASEKNNRAYLDDSYNLVYAPYSAGGFLTKKVDLTLPSYLANNTNYFSTVLGFYPHEYVPLEWSYALGADYLDNLRNKFKNIYYIDNDFSVWSGCQL